MADCEAELFTPGGAYDVPPYGYEAGLVADLTCEAAVTTDEAADGTEEEKPPIVESGFGKEDGAGGC